MSDVNEEKEAPQRPIEPKTGAVILLGSMAASWAVAWLLWTFVPFGPEAFERLRSPLTNEGAWLILSAWLLFPAVYGFLLLRLAPGVDPYRAAWAFAGVTYFLQSAAEIVGRNDITLWPELLFTAVPTIVFFSLARRRAPEQTPESDSPA